LSTSNLKYLNTKSIAHEISRINAKLKKEGHPYLLIGPGRWGSADPWLGIPVRWEDISRVATMIELRNDQLSAEDSQGTHFFHNITAMSIKYFTITENDGRLADFINWQWLTALAAVEETKYVRHVRLKNNLLIKVDSQTSQGVVLAND